MATSHDCDFCSIPDSNIGVQKFVKVTEKSLSDILEEENEVGGKKKKQKIGHKLMSHYDKYLKHIFGFCEKDELSKKFNFLALDKIRTQNGTDVDDIGNKSTNPSLVETIYANPIVPHP